MKKELDLVTIGHLAIQEDRLLNGTTHFANVGSGYYVSAGASLIPNAKIGLVARVGDDFDLKSLKQWKVDLQGVHIVKGGKSPHFISKQYSGGAREFKAEMGVAAKVDLNIFPDSYLKSSYIHLATNLPHHQLLWLKSLRNKISKNTTISVDTFEKWVKQYREKTKEVLMLADLIFTNEEEWSTLQQYSKKISQVPLILKRGKFGAVYIERQKRIEVLAPYVDAVDTTGAGEILAGVFLALRSQGIPVAIALEQAVLKASKSVTKPGVEHLHI